MEMIYKGKYIWMISILLFASCSSKLYKPDEANSNYTASIEDLKKGRKLYISKCSSCHALHLPSQYKKEEWPHLVDKMEERAQINSSEKELILIYLWNAPVAAN